MRELEFLEPVSVSLLSQHRKVGGYGLHGGENGAPGRQSIVRKDGSRATIEGITQEILAAGERIRVETPGGGGWGSIAR